MLEKIQHKLFKIAVCKLNRNIRQTRPGYVTWVKAAERTFSFALFFCNTWSPHHANAATAELYLRIMIMTKDSGDHCHFTLTSLFDTSPWSTRAWIPSSRDWLRPSESLLDSCSNGGREAGVELQKVASLGIESSLRGQGGGPWNKLTKMKTQSGSACWWTCHCVHVTSAVNSGTFFSRKADRLIAREGEWER